MRQPAGGFHQFFGTGASRTLWSQLVPKMLLAAREPYQSPTLSGFRYPQRFFNPHPQCGKRSRLVGRLIDRALIYSQSDVSGHP
jgi:hypothetical protein